MKKILILLFISLSANAQIRRCCFNKASQDVTNQAAMDAIAAVADYGHSVIPITGGGGGVFTTTGLTTLCVSGQECMGIKAFGNNKPTPSDLLFAGNATLGPTNAVVWFKDLQTTSLAAIYLDYGNWDRFLRFFNGPPNVSYYETNPGSFTAKTQPIDYILALRYIPHTADEGVNRIKALNATLSAEALSAIDGWTPDITLSGGQTYPHYTDAVVRVLVRADNTWQVWINGVSQATGTSVNFSTTEWIWGTGSHCLQTHVRYNIAKFGEFTAGELTTIYTNSQTIWPWGVKPSYPLITELYYGDASSWDGTGKKWRPGLTKTPVFSGGTGTAGTHKYVWYFCDANDATLFPSADGVLTNHRQVPASVDISTIASGNSVTSISMDGAVLCTSCGTYATSATATADAIVTLINGNQTDYVAQRRGTATILFHPNTNKAGTQLYKVSAISAVTSGFTATTINAPRTQDLVRTTYGVTGQIFDGHQGDGSMKIGCVVYPFDNAGTAGEPLPMRWVIDNIP